MTPVTAFCGRIVYIGGMSFDQTLNDSREFTIFSLALMTLSKSARVLLQCGADPAAILHINRAIQLISKQLDDAAARLETDLQATREIEELCKTLGIARPEEEEQPPDSAQD